MGVERFSLCSTPFFTRSRFPSLLKAEEQLPLLHFFSSSNMRSCKVDGAWKKRTFGSPFDFSHDLLPRKGNGHIILSDVFFFFFKREYHAPPFRRRSPASLV